MGPAHPMIEVLLFCLLPAFGIVAGCLLAESMHTPKWLIGAALHSTAGVAIALVSVDLMPRMLGLSSIPQIIAGFLAGALVSVLIARLWGTFRFRAGRGTVGAWMVFVAVATDLTGDGLMVGAGFAVGEDLGLLLAATQSFANIPGGFAATSNFRDDGMPRRQRLGLALFMIVPAVISGVTGYTLLHGAGPVAQGMVMAFFTGVLLLATIEDVVPQGDEPQPPRWVSTSAFALGFSSLALLWYALN